MRLSGVRRNACGAEITTRGTTRLFGDWAVVRTERLNKDRNAEKSPSGNN
jgi:hypothetical protein